MNKNELQEKINLIFKTKTFSDLYGSNDSNSAQDRYKMLLKGMFDEELLAEAAGQARFFSAPGRTELGGNHTDHNRGKVIAASIQLDNAAIVAERKDSIVFFRSTGYPDVKVKLTDSSGKPDLQPKPEEKGKTESLVRGIAAELDKRGFKTGGFSANADSTVLPGSGLSSSAAVEVLLCGIFCSLFGDGKSLSAMEIAQITQAAENNYFGKPCGLMDQSACAAGGAVAIDFENAASPAVNRINFDLEAAGYSLCVVNTGGNHADLTSDYAAIPAEMKAVASLFGKSVLREIDKETVVSNAAKIRKALGDRALLRSLHFFDENARVDAMAAALAKMSRGENKEQRAESREYKEALYRYLDLVNESGDSSWMLLQNIYPPHCPESQGISAALALTKDFFRREKLLGYGTAKAACRVHGGGFAGTIQVYLPLEKIDAYRSYIETIFGTGSVTVLRIRSTGTVELKC